MTLKMLGFHPAPRRLPQRNPDPASIGRKFHAGCESLERDDHALSIGQLYASDAPDPGTAPANSVICAGEVLDFAQARDAPVSRIAEAPAVTPRLKP
jgi:hypothetical protein